MIVEFWKQASWVFQKYVLHNPWWCSASQLASHLAISILESLSAQKKTRDHHDDKSRHNESHLIEHRDLATWRNSLDRLDDIERNIKISNI